MEIAEWIERRRGRGGSACQSQRLTAANHPAGEAGAPGGVYRGWRVPDDPGERSCNRNFRHVGRSARWAMDPYWGNRLLDYTEGGRAGSGLLSATELRDHRWWDQPNRCNAHYDARIPGCGSRDPM